MGAAIGNKYAVGNNGGRPPAFETQEQLILEVDAYFEYVKGLWHEEMQEIQTKEGPKIEKVRIWDRQPENVTITGLTLFLGFCSRSSLDDYEKRQEFSYIIKRARARVENSYEQGLYSQGCTGAIFALKNMGWSDKTEIDHTNKGGKFGEEPDLSNYTEDELRTLAELQRKGRASEA